MLLGKKHIRQSSEDKSKHLHKRLDHWIELGRFPPNVNVSDVISKTARVGGSNSSLFFTVSPCISFTKFYLHQRMHLFLIYTKTT